MRPPCHRWRDRGAPGGGVLIEHVFREEWGCVLAALRGLLGDFDLAEEAAQEAFTIAAERWPEEGMPANPGAWLIATGRNRAIDRIRRERTGSAKAKLLEAPQAVEEDWEETAFPDERLELVFTCCHPALALDAQVALTLRTLGGLGTDEIARAFVVPRETMAKPARRVGEFATSFAATSREPLSVQRSRHLPMRREERMCLLEM